MVEATEMKDLLRLAEARIEELAADNASLSQAYSDLMEAQKLETAQLVALTEQIWALEEALQSTSSEKDSALGMLAMFKSRFQALRDQATETLQAAAKNASRLELAARVYDIAIATEEEELERMTREYNERVARQRRGG
ncbi:MAG: hypothetical protein HQL40_05145 [Alphaproteobacteria bacterium]|nr:hypothetical protein [Alphaproteobacteria bacterium]